MYSGCKLLYLCAAESEQCAFPVRNSPIQMDLAPDCCNVTCTVADPVIKTSHSCLPPKGKPGFHAEWLRDGPCDATTTCLGKPGVWCQLSLAERRETKESRSQKQSSLGGF